MGRSKFPGKPSKHVNRQRVNVLACSQNSETNKTVVIAENIFIGLSDNNTSNPQNGPKQVDQITHQDRHLVTSKTRRTRNGQVALKKNVASSSLKNRKRHIKTDNLSCAIRRGRGRAELLARRARSADSINLGGKFILPSRSAHSSRVIKPNKRFVDSESGSDKSDNVRKVATTNVESGGEDEEKSDVTMPGNSVTYVPEDVTATNVTTSGNRLILRKAKLQLSTHSSPMHRTQDSHGPFSMSTATESGGGIVSPGTVTCGVCGAVRFYRFVKQARKFSIYSCESCRKFISKMIKRQACNKSGAVPKLVCHKGQGVCHVPPIVRSQQWNLIRCAYKARCPACWLKMCLRSFKMPTKLRSNLAEMLPANMQSIENLAMDTTLSGTFGWKKMITPIKSPKTTFTAAISFDNITNNKLQDNDNQLHTHLENRSKRATAHLRTRKKDTPMSDTATTSVTVYTDKVLRQKLSLKGPRVKHVCRSASIVLGQTPATFQTNLADATNLTDVGGNSVPECHSDVTGQDCDDCTAAMIGKVGAMSQSSSGSSNESELEDTKTTQPTYTSFQLPSKLQQVCSEPVYDAVEVRQHGFGLFMSRGVVPKEVCFLCGSAGQEQMIHCAVCCEPYHDFCVGSDAATAYIGSWTCARCVVTCTGCSKSATRTTPCLLCRKLFHTTCLGMYNALCSKCSRCSDCGKDTVDQIIGNIAFCSSCFCLKYENDHCPHCSKGFSNKSEVILCPECKCIWHTDCDNISKEQLAMLRTLSLCEQYTCHRCLINKRMNTNATWRDKLSSHFVVGCLSVLRALAELRVAQNYNSKSSQQQRLSGNNSNGSTSIIEKDYATNMMGACANKTKDGRQKDDIQTTGGATNPSNVSQTNKQTDKTVPEYLKQKFFLRDCSVSIQSIKLEHLGNKYRDIFDEFVPDSTDSALCDLKYKNCNCTETLTLLEVKRKVVSKDYMCLSEFRHDLDLAIRGSGWNELFNVVDSIFCKEFPWCAIMSKSTYAATCADQSQGQNQKLTNTYNDCSICNKLPDVDSCKTLSDDLDEDESDDVEMYDSRNCVLCLCHGDKSDMDGGRLLYCESNTCIHVACAIWSVGVHETLDGALLGVAATVRRARLARCVFCKLRGATIDCSDQYCKATYHFPCARKAGCLFVKNYRVFCVEHAKSHRNKQLQLSDEDFQIRRSVYVHMDLKKQIVSELHSKWQFVVGSLVIRQLGTYYPVLSDVDDVIIPSGMACTKLFWSTVEPWRIVQYNITTFVCSDEDNVYCGNENNISIDHSEVPEVVEHKLALVKKIFHEVDDDTSDSESDTEDVNKIQDILQVCRDVLNNLIETVSQSVDEEELPQSATDILPPEIKDAIFEDLPHEVFDGISMQDIFIPNIFKTFNVNDEVLNINEAYIIKSDTVKDQNEDLNSTSKRRTDRDPCWSISRSLDDSHPPPNRMNRSLKRSKSDLLPLNTFQCSVSNPHQRSCSLTWSCKLNGNNAIKKRKISCVTEVESNLLMMVSDLDQTATQQDKMSDLSHVLRRRILQVDGLNDSSDSETDDDIPPETSNLVWNYVQSTAPGQVATAPPPPPCESGEVEAADEPVRCQRCQCTYRTPDSYARHLNACETMSTSDSESEEQLPSDALLPSKNSSAAILNVKHHNIYSNITITSTTTSVMPSNSTILPPPSATETVNKHPMPAPDVGKFITPANQFSGPVVTPELVYVNNNTSRATSNVINVPTNNQVQYAPVQTNLNKVIFNAPIQETPTIQAQPVIEVPVQQTPITQDKIVYNGLVTNPSQQIYANANIQGTILDNTLTFQTPQIPAAPFNSVIEFQNTNTRVNPEIETPKYIISSVTDTPQTTDNQTFAQIQNFPSNLIQQSTIIDNNIYSAVEPVKGTVIVQSNPQIQPETITRIVTPLSVRKKPTNTAQIAITPNKKVRNRPVRRAIAQKQIRIESDPNTIHLMPVQNIPQQNTVMVQQTPIFQSAKQLFMHPLGTTDLTGFTTDIMKPNNILNPSPNVQYILTPNINCNQLVTAPATNTFQIPQQMNIISDINNPEVMITSSPIVGNLVIQSTPQLTPATPSTAFECGIMHSNVEQILFAPQVQTNPTTYPCMYVSGLGTNQPVFYGLETVVQNTVMSQQFMSKVGLPGLLAQNSYHTATTQVFQTSTIEPVIPEIQSQSCVVMQPQNVLASHITAAQPHQSTPQLNNPATATATAIHTITPGTSTGQLLPMPVMHRNATQQYGIVNTQQMTQPPAQPPPAQSAPTPAPPPPPPPPIRLHTQISPQQNHNITLPLAPVHTNNKLPTNVVPPTPQTPRVAPTPTVTRPSRPMNRVLPMTVTKPLTKQQPPQTASPFSNENSSKPLLRLCDNILDKKIDTIKEISEKLPVINNTLSAINDKQKVRTVKIDVSKTLQINTSPTVPSPSPAKPLTPQILSPNFPVDSQINSPGLLRAPTPPNPPAPSPTPILSNPQIEIPKELTASYETVQNENDINLENGPLKLVFQKQSEEGIYKVSNKPLNSVSNFLSSKSSPKISSKENIPLTESNESANKEKNLKTEKKLKKSRKQMAANIPVLTKKKSSKLLFKVQSQDGLSLTCGSLTELWHKVFNLVQESRKHHNMPPLPVDALNGYEALGLKNQSLKCILEEMKKLRLAEKQKEIEDDDSFMQGSPCGAARCSPFTGQRADHDMFSWLASRHRQLEFPERNELNDTVSRRASSINLPIAMRYRNLKETSKHCVGVYRSNIHGRGLFCLRDIELGEMVIEYAGEVIRSSMTDMREKYYNSKGIGCYMFRIDDNLVVDATVKGNAARFINHSCDPNCYSRVLDILGHKHILIFALRKIQQGEELTYDYKFPFEEDKIPCTCGARRCRKYLN